VRPRAKVTIEYYGRLKTTWARDFKFGTRLLSRSSARVRGWRRKLVRFGLGPPQLFLPSVTRV